jgi:hypothetical protein
MLSSSDLRRVQLTNWADKTLMLIFIELLHLSDNAVMERVEMQGLAAI